MKNQNKEEKCCWVCEDMPDPTDGKCCWVCEDMPDPTDGKCRSIDCACHQPKDTIKEERYFIYKVRNGCWKLEWSDGSFSEHSTQDGAERMVLQIEKNRKPKDPKEECSDCNKSTGGYCNNCSKEEKAFYDFHQNTFDDVKQSLIIQDWKIEFDKEFFGRFVDLRISSGLSRKITDFWLSKREAEWKEFREKIKEKPMNTFSFVLKGEELELYMQHKGWNKCREHILKIIDQKLK